jgi:hypothetical protein
LLNLFMFKSKKVTQHIPTVVAKVIFDFKIAFIVLFGFLTKSNTALAQVSAYTFSEAITGYTALTGTPTVAFTTGWDNAVTPVITMPFTFIYDGLPQTQCRINANGFLTFGATASTITNILPLSTTTTTTPGVISALARNLSSSNPVVYGIEGAAPNRVFVVQWTNAVTAGSGNYTFQIRLYETSNIIEFSYGACGAISMAGIGVEVGLRGPNNNIQQGNINNRSMVTTNQAWFSHTQAGTAVAASVFTNNLSYPDLGLSYKWTPAPLCATPTAAPTALVLGNTSIDNTSVTGNSFTPASPAATNYLILRSTTSQAPTAVDIPNRIFGVVNTPFVTGSPYTVISISNATAFNQTGLSADTTYYYWIIPYNGNCTGAPYYFLGGILSGSVTTCSNPAVADAATAIGGNDFNANWSFVPGATNYRLDVSTTSTFATFVTGYNDLSVGNVNTYHVAGLNPLTTYYYRVKSVGVSCIVNSNTVFLTTACGAFSIPYTQNFDAPATALGNIPTCTTRIDSNGDLTQWGVRTAAYASAPRSLMIYQNTMDMDDWFFLPGLTLNGGVTYRLLFKYNTGNTSGTVTENLKIKIGQSADIASMTQTLLDMPNINNTLFKPIYVDFTPVATGTYYIGFNGLSTANQSFIALDDINVILSPTCFEPSDVTAFAITANTATISWTAPVPEPANGYEYYLSTNATVPVSGTVPTGTTGTGITSISLAGLQSSNSYYIWVRGKCSITDKSIWSVEENFSTECTTPVVTGNTPASRCGYGTVTLNAVPNNGSVINWYAAATGGSPIFTGNSYVTPAINATTTYYAEAKAFGAIAKTGPLTPAAQTGTIGIQNFASTVFFNVTENTTLQSIDIFPNASNQNGTFILRNSDGTNLATFSYITTASGGNTLQTVIFGYALVPGNYSLLTGTLPASGFSMNMSSAIYPYTSSVASIYGNSFDNTQYAGLYNWKFTTECLSGRIPVTATVNSPPALTISSSSATICENTSSDPITVSGYGSYNNFVWSPDTNVSGSVSAGFTFNPTTTTTYTLTASQSSGSLCSSVVSITINVSPSPTAVVMVPSAAITICQNEIQLLTGSVGTSSNIPILTENFNGAMSNWIVANTSTYGNLTASQWTLQPNAYVYSSGSTPTPVTFKSPDNTQFFFANADAQSSNSNAITRTTLQSPNFSLVGYISASLTFSQHIRYATGDSFLIEVSIDNWATSTVIKQYTATTGTETSFTNSTVDLNAFLGKPNVSIRYKFISNWDWWWALDNVVVTGTIASALSWSPATDLYTDASATVPYELGTQLSEVYAKPITTTTYTATATGGNGCTSTGIILVNVDLIPVPGTISSNQVLCSGGSPSNIVLTGSIGNIIRWEYADDAAFTVNVTAIANTTNTLLPAQMGVFSTIRYFRAVVKSGVCAQVYSTVVSVSFPTTTWNGTVWSNGLPGSGVKAIFAGNFTSSANLSACSVQVLSGTVTIASGHSLLVDNEVTVIGGSLVFEDTASLVQYSTTAVNIGNIIYKRNTTPMVKYDYTYWSSPVASQTLSAFSPNSNPTTYYEWSTALNNWSFVPGSTIMQQAKGYIVRAPDIAPFNTVTPNIFNGSFTGVPNNGTITIPMSLNGTDSLNLIGNPYPSAISADLFLSDPSNINSMNGTIYLWTHNTQIAANVYTSNDYAVYNYMGGVGTSAAVNNGVNNAIPTGNIAAGESFFVEGLMANNATFRNTMRLVGVNNQFFRQNNELSSPLSTTSTKHRLWLDITNSQGAFKQTLVGYAADATLGYDRNYDGTFVDGGNVVGLYSINLGQKFTIQGLPLPFSTDDRVPLGFMTTVAGAFDVALSQFDGLFLSQDVYLEDQYLHVFHNLKSSSYNFTTDAGTFDDRFVLRYSSEALSTPQFTASNLVIYKPDSKWIVNSGNATMKSIRVFDVRGRLLFENKAVNASETSFYIGVTNEVLLVQITSTDGVIVTKKVVN